MLKKWSRALASSLVPFIGSWLIRFLYLTNKKVFHTNNPLPDESTIYACWHGDLMMFAHSYLKYKNTSRVKAVISSHFDGTLIAGTLEKFGFEIIAGSSNKNAVRVLIQAIKALKEGYDIGITPDGPRGPRHEVADGIIAMAQKTGKKVILVEIRPLSYWQLSSWDKFVIPKPFGTIHFYYSDPLEIQGMQTEDAREMIKKGLLKHEN
ncbi:lysophospholipid acyltransferase family protein [Sulfurimonas sp. SAG-AH-194-L11]|nr:lysophospholipid acyltransferase family protein [Sulfurimonas sp. SAG-AH-194-L11]MDF1876765.1 lysophospholipid acyltransferase family protein [Sulfurimonas sp. SAG-AH-194-L11]